jgi:hypothetical protein
MDLIGARATEISANKGACPGTHFPDITIRAPVTARVWRSTFITTAPEVSDASNGDPAPRGRCRTPTIKVARNWQDVYREFGVS